MGDTKKQQQTDAEKRGRQPEVPFGYEALLTDAQRIIIDKYRALGWELKFIRRTQFLDPTIVMTDPADKKVWQVTDQGDLVAFKNARDRR